MTMPTPQEARSRQAAMEAERHWWVQNLSAIRYRFAKQVELPTNGVIYVAGLDAGKAAVLAEIEALIAERTR